MKFKPRSLERRETCTYKMKFKPCSLERKKLLSEFAKSDFQKSAPTRTLRSVWVLLFFWMTNSPLTYLIVAVIHRCICFEAYIARWVRFLSTQAISIMKSVSIVVFVAWRITNWTKNMSSVICFLSSPLRTTFVQLCQNMKQHFNRLK